MLLKNLSNNYDKKECVLLNTHFTLKDRRRKIWLCKRRLKQGEKIILISTQLIEAGVDIDFPNVYRDFCPLPSLIQAAGRCNRNGELTNKDGNLQFGDVFFFALQKESGKFSSELIYRDEAKNFLKYCRDNLPETTTESEFYKIQKDFFKTEIGEYLKFGVHNQFGEELDFVKLINKAAFETSGVSSLFAETCRACCLAARDAVFLSAGFFSKFIFKDDYSPWQLKKIIRHRRRAARRKKRRQAKRQPLRPGARKNRSVKWSAR